MPLSESHTATLAKIAATAEVVGEQSLIALSAQNKGPEKGVDWRQAENRLTLAVVEQRLAELESGHHPQNVGVVVGDDRIDFDLDCGGSGDRASDNPCDGHPDVLAKAVEFAAEHGEQWDLSPDGKPPTTCWWSATTGSMHLIFARRRAEPIATTPKGYSEYGITCRTGNAYAVAPPSKVKTDEGLKPYKWHKNGRIEPQLLAESIEDALVEQAAKAATRAECCAEQYANVPYENLRGFFLELFGRVNWAAVREYYDGRGKKWRHPVRCLPLHSGLDVEDVRECMAMVLEADADWNKGRHNQRGMSDIDYETNRITHANGELRPRKHAQHKLQSLGLIAQVPGQFRVVRELETKYGIGVKRSVTDAKLEYYRNQLLDDLRELWPDIYFDAELDKPVFDQLPMDTSKLERILTLMQETRVQLSDTKDAPVESPDTVSTNPTWRKYRNLLRAACESRGLVKRPLRDLFEEIEAEPELTDAERAECDEWLGMVFVFRRECDRTFIHWASMSPLVAAVAGVFEPNPAEQLDQVRNPKYLQRCVPVLYGGQKIGKSSVAAVLLPARFYASVTLSGNKSVMANSTRSKALVELAEMVGVDSARHAGLIKDILSSQVLNARLPYESSNADYSMMFGRYATANHRGQGNAYLPSNDELSRYVALEVELRKDLPSGVAPHAIVYAKYRRIWKRAIELYRMGSTIDLPEGSEDDQLTCNVDHRKYEDELNAACRAVMRVAADNGKSLADFDGVTLEQWAGYVFGKYYGHGRPSPMAVAECLEYHGVRWNKTGFTRGAAAQWTVKSALTPDEWRAKMNEARPRGDNSDLDIFGRD